MLKKSSLVAVIFIFVLLIGIISYQFYSFLSLREINGIKSQIALSYKVWGKLNNSLIRQNLLTIKKVFLQKDLQKLILEYDEHLTKLSEINVSKDSEVVLKFQKIKESIQSALKDIILDDNQFIAVFDVDGNIIYSSKKDLGQNFNIKNFLDSSQNVLTVNNEIFKINLMPYNVQNEPFAYIISGTKLAEPSFETLSDLSDVKGIVLNENEIVQTNFSKQMSDYLFKRYINGDKKLNFILKNSMPEYKNKILYTVLGNEDYWIAGSFIDDSSLACFLLVQNPDWVYPYIYLESNKITLYSVIALISLIIAISFYLLLKLTSKTSTKIIKTEESTKKYCKPKVDKKIDKKIDGFIDLITRVLLSPLFQNNKELKEVAGNFLEIIKEFKVKMALETYSKELSNDLSNDNIAQKRYSTVYVSTIKNIVGVVEDENLSNTFNLLNIYIKIQQELITENRGKIIKQTDENIIAVFESINGAKEAIKASFEIMSTLKNLSSLNSKGYNVSIGLSSGEVVVGYLSDNLNYIGYPVKIATSLSNKAPSGHLVIDKSTYKAAGIDNVTAKEGTCKIRNLKTEVDFYFFNPDDILFSKIKSAFADVETTKQIHSIR